MINLRKLLNLPPLTTLRLTKLEAARRQLRTAIVMFLEDRDPVSIYALASAAQDVLRGLLKAKGKEAISVKDSDFVKPEWLTLWRRSLNQYQNFLKHADEDPDEVLEFKLDLLPVTLIDCVRMYSALTGQMIREGAAFMTWYTRQYPDRLKPGVFAESARRAGAVDRGSILRLLNQPEQWPGTD